VEEAPVTAGMSESRMRWSDRWRSLKRAVPTRLQRRGTDRRRWQQNMPEIEHMVRFTAQRAVPHRKNRRVYTGVAAPRIEEKRLRSR
jgi:hypothetical protein